MEFLIAIACVIIMVVGVALIIFGIGEEQFITFLGGVVVLIFGIKLLTSSPKPTINSKKQRKQKLLKELKELKKDKSLYKLKTENDKLEDSIYKIKNGL